MSLTVPADQRKRDKLSQSTSDSKANAGNCGKLPCQAQKVSPEITVAEPRVALVAKAYQAGAEYTPHRLAVTLKATNASFAGRGVLSWPQDQVAFYPRATGGAKLDLSKGIDGAKLASGYTVYAQALKPSASVDGTELSLALENPGPLTIENSPHKAQLTCVELTLDICQPRSGPGDPAALSAGNKINPGRLLHLHDQRDLAGRATLIVRKAKPDDFQEPLLLKSAAGVRAYENNALVADAYSIAAGQLPKTLEAEGQSASAKLREGNFILTTESLPDAEGDRVNVTVVKLVLDICKSRDNRLAHPSPMDAEGKLNTGRFLHKQVGTHHGRAKLIVRKAEPAVFTGPVELKICDAGGANSNKLKLYSAEHGGAAEAANPVAIAQIPEAGWVRWVEGADVSGALRDLQIRLKLRDAEGEGDRVAFTVIKFTNLTADIPVTPPNTARLANGPVARHVLTLDGSSADHFDGDYTKNVPLVLIEDSVKDTDPIQLSVAVEPAAAQASVGWSVVRAAGDHADIVKLSGDPTVVVAGDELHRNLKADAVGTFRVAAYVDSNGNSTFDYENDAGLRIDREPFILMNLVLVRAEGVSNLARTNAAAVGPKAGPWRFSTANAGKDCIDITGIIQLTGGGADGTRGLDRVFCGWVNNQTSEDCTEVFHKNVAPAVTDKVLTCIRVSAPHHGGRYNKVGANYRCRCGCGGMATIEAWPILDSGYDGPQGSGGNTCVGTNGSNGPDSHAGNGLPAMKKRPGKDGIGGRREVHLIDSPGGSVRRVHPDDATFLLSEFRFNLDFRSDLVVWTNRNQAIDNSDFPACRLYSTVQTNTWTIRVRYTYDAVQDETEADAFTVACTRDADATRRSTPVDGSGLEVRLPDNCDLIGRSYE